ncbi:MAG: hypothetical protein LBQ84_02200 [Flavobacteriaceae bacterium]|jgi:HD-GYP domain-containing protein (c-di-GMP phosphodiesterase class II)|nr:hypothetical protein [Flavobacteriaceae bacterium]
MAENESLEEEEEKTLSPTKSEDSSIEKDEEVIPKDILEAIPAEDRGKMVSIIKESMISGVMTRGNPISDKITSEHITKLIDKSDSLDLRDREERKENKYYNITILLIGLVFLGFLIIYLKEDKELLYKIIIAIVSFIGGFGLGKTSFTKKEE